MDADAPDGHQATLAGIAPPPVQASVRELLDAGDPMRIAIQGHLLTDAVVRDTSSGLVLLEVTVRQVIAHHPQALPFFASLVCPDAGGFAETHRLAMHKAAGLKAGVEVHVLGEGVELGHHHGAQVFRLLATQGIARVDSHPLFNQEANRAH